MQSHPFSIDNRHALTIELGVCFLFRQVATVCTVLYLCQWGLFRCVIGIGLVSFKLALLRCSAHGAIASTCPAIMECRTDCPQRFVQVLFEHHTETW